MRKKNQKRTVSRRCLLSRKLFPAPSKEDETLRAQLHEAEAQEDLAKEMSQLAEEHGYSEETQAAQTQVLADIRHLKKGPMYSGSNHLMIEADEPEKGFELAVKTLKRIHRNRR